MQNQFYAHGVHADQTRSNLHHMVNRLAISSLPMAIRNRSFIVNDVPDELFVSTDSNVLASVLSGLIQSLIIYTTNGCVRVSANRQDDTILIQVKDNGQCDKMSVEKRIAQVRPLAEKLGGALSVTDNGTNVIMFAFRNILKAA